MNSLEQLQINGQLGSKHDAMKKHNEKLVLHLVRIFGHQTKSEISAKTGLTAQTLSRIMRSLEDCGLLMRGARQKGKKRTTFHTVVTKSRRSTFCRHEARSAQY